MSAMTPHSGPGVTVYYAQALIQWAEDNGQELPAELVDRIQGLDRVPLAWQDELWEAWCSLNPDPLAAIRLGANIHIGNLDSAGLLLVTCETLGEALQELEAYAPVISDGASFRMRRDGELVYVQLTHQMGVRAIERTEVALAALLYLARWATADKFQPAGVWFTHAPLAPVAKYEAALGTTVHFSAPYTSLGLSLDQLNLPMTQANASLHDHIREYADRVLDGLGSNNMVIRVQQVVRHNPSWGRERVAEHFQMSGRQLNRRLEEEGLSFKVVRERTLEHLAVRHLRDGVAVAEIASWLGYSGETAFTRAFRRWHGITPAQFRSSAT